jgi:hypothetical protein
MASESEVAAALALAQSAELTYSQMATLLKHAIVSAMIDGSGNLVIPWQTTGSDGTTISRMQLSEARLLLKFLQSNSGGGVLLQPIEFSPEYRPTTGYRN